jgi:hypothetical protein
MQDLIERLRNIPAEILLQMFCISESKVECYLNARRSSLEDSLTKFLKQKWKARDTGEFVPLSDFFEYEFNIDIKKVKSALRNHSFTIERLEELTQPFVNQKIIYC